jgi:hypothetical protein
MTSPVAVLLDEADHEFALDAGRRRQGNAVAKEIPDRYGFEGNGLRIHQQGCLAELAVARWLGSEWVDFATDFKRLRSDVGGLQVRSTEVSYGRMLLHPGDPDDQAFILARTHREPTIYLVGWMFGKEAKRDEWWGELKPGRPCYIVNNGALLPMEALKHEHQT